MSQPLPVYCTKHPRYRALQRTRVKCNGCEALYALRWQHARGREAERRLGSLNHLQWFDTEEGLGLLALRSPRGAQ